MAVEKTIEQLLRLSKNPYFKLNDKEKERLDSFLSKQQEEDSKDSQKKSSKKSSDKTNARVKNVVRKSDTTAPEASADAQNPRTVKGE